MIFKFFGITLTVFLLFVFNGCASKKDVVSFGDSVKLQNQEKVINEGNKTILSETMPLNNIVSTVSEIENKTNDNNNGGNYTTTSTINGENIVLESIYFDYKVFTLSEQNLIIATSNSDKILKTSLKSDAFKIKLEGNCDEIGSDEYNYALGLKRAEVIKKNLLSKGIPDNRVVVVSYGESNPICKEQTDECWQKNRRVDYSLVP